MKQIIVVNEALKLPRGKLAVQVAHAALGAFTEAGAEVKQTWLEKGMPKIVLSVDSEAALIRLHDLAKSRNIPVQLVRDAGRTVLSSGTVTCLGLGPAANDEIDVLTGDLKLLR